MERSTIFRDTRGLAKVCLAFLFVQGALAAVGAVSDYWTYTLPDAALIDTVDTAAPMTAQDMRVLLIALTQSLLYIVGGIVILTWISRANANAHVIGTLEMETGPAWAVGWFFVPFANLFMPFRVVREIWQASATALAGERASGALLGFWWLSWLGTNITGLAAMRIAWESQSAEALRTSAGFDIASNILMIPACLLLAGVITRIQDVQNRAAPISTTGSVT
jgi:hypothetical protein